MPLRTKTPWKWQPQGQIAVDRNNPLTKGLLRAVLFRGANAWDVVTGAALTAVSSTNLELTNSTVGRGGKSILSGTAYWTLPVLAGENATSSTFMSIVAAGSVGSFSVITRDNTASGGWLVARANLGIGFASRVGAVDPSYGSSIVPAVGVPGVHILVCQATRWDEYWNSGSAFGGSSAAGSSAPISPWHISANATNGNGSENGWYLWCSWNRPLSAIETSSAVENPWQIFAPLRRRNRSAGTGANIYTITPSGGVAFSGAIPLLRTRAQVPSGGITLSGAVPLLRTRALNPTGSVSFSGTAPITFNTPNIYTITPSGSVIFSGAASLLRTRTFVPAGSVSFSGTAPLVRTRLSVPSGQVTFSGTSPIVFIPAGGVPAGDVNRISIGLSRASRLS